jgi:hypothetical protein
MKIIDSTIISKEEQAEIEKETILKNSNKLIQDLSKSLQKSNIKIDKINEDNTVLLNKVEKLSDVTKITLGGAIEHNSKSTKLQEEEIQQSKKIQLTINDKLSDVENKISELKKTYNELSQKQVNAVKKNNVTQELASIDEKITEMVDLLKKIKDKKQTTTVVGGGGGGGTYIPLKNGNVPTTNPDGTYIGNSLGVPKHDSGTVSYPTDTKEVYTFKLNGATVGTVTIEYTDNTKALMSSWSIA